MDNNNTTTTSQDTPMTETPNASPLPLGTTLGANRERLKQRKQRRVTSCFPCRDRKVKCDKGRPCDTCKERKHPELCSYDRVPSNASGTPSVSHASPRPPRSNNRITAAFLKSPATTPLRISSRKNNLQNTPVSPTIVQPPSLGDNAIPSFARAQSNGSGPSTGRTENIEEGLLPILGIGKTSVPAESFSIIMMGQERIHKGLPADRTIIKLFENFKTEVHSFTPIISDIKKLEKQVYTFIDQRGAPKKPDPLPRPILWLALLYAILASGSQFKEASHIERTSESDKYLRYSFQCLRFADYLMEPTIECLETLLVLGIVLQNLMKPQAAWILLGTTSRIAQSLGIHRKPIIQGQLSRDNKLWLSVIWQDALLSLSFDRLPTTMEVPNFSLSAENLSSLSYVEAMYSLLVSAHRGFSIKSHSTGAFEEVLDIIESISAIQEKTQAHLRSSEDCETIQQRCEHYALQLHTSFVAGWLSTRAFRRPEIAQDQDQSKSRAELAQTGIRCLIRSLEAYLKLCPISLQASRSWVFIHNGLSSALVLALTNESRTKAEVRNLQNALIQTLGNGFDDPGSNDDQNGTVFLSPQHERVLGALENLYNEHIPKAAQPPIALKNLYSGQPSETTQVSTGALGEQPQMTESQTTRSIDPTAFLGFSDMCPMETFDSIIWGEF